MNSEISTEQFSRAADQLLESGVAPSVEKIGEILGVDPDCLGEHLRRWWSQLPERIRIQGGNVPNIPELPGSLAKSMGALWQQALQEAHLVMTEDVEFQNLANEEARRHSESELRKAQDDQVEMENQFRDLVSRLEESKQHEQALDAEISVLKINLATVTTELKSEEQRRENVEQERQLIQKKLDDSKKTFDQRVKEEQRHSLELVAKAEADTRYYRSSLEKLRDECGRKESALTKDIHNLQALVAKKDVKLDTLTNQIKALETELKRFKSEGTHTVREKSKLSGSLLAEQNRNKRLEDRVAELTEELKRTNQKNLSSTNEAARRENTLRGQLKDKEEELFRRAARITSLEKKISTHEEEIRRLRSRLS